MTAELYGMFFVAEDVFGDTSQQSTSRPMELTCYRRNLFQISGTVTLSRGIKSCINEQGQQVPLYDLTATLSALESIEGKSTEIISVPWKTSTSSSLSSTEDKAGAAPPKWPLDLSMNPELDPAVVTIPIAWKRLQFKHATANNGRRKGLQQHYVIQINLVGTTATGESIKLAEIQSGPIIVRGRSPRNFDSRKDVSLGDGKKKEGRSGSDAEQRERMVKVDPGVTNGNYRFFALNALQVYTHPYFPFHTFPLHHLLYFYFLFLSYINIYKLTQPKQQPLDLPEWTNANTITNPLPSPSLPSESPSRQVKKPTLTHQSSSTSSSTLSRPPVPKTQWRAENNTNPNTNKQPSISVSAAPIDLSLADDEYGKRGSMGGGDISPSVERREFFAGEMGKRSEKGGEKGGVLGGSPIENADLLYEYFPLSLDDWYVYFLAYFLFFSLVYLGVRVGLVGRGKEGGGREGVWWVRVRSEKKKKG
jgi:hypothetical protein